MFREGEVDDKIDMRGERGMEKVFCFHLEADNGQKVSHRSLEWRRLSLIPSADRIPLGKGWRGENLMNF